MRTQIANFQCIVENPGQSNAVVLFHGFGAEYSDLAPLAEVIDPDGEWTWIFPNGPKTVDIGGGMTGRAWFPISIADLNQSLMTGIPRDYSAMSSKGIDDIYSDLEFFIEDLKKEYEGLVLGGFSQGGMVATHILAKAGDSLRGLLLMSTVLLDAAKLEERLTGVTPRKVFMSHGTKDMVLSIKYAQMLYQFFKKTGWKGTWVDFAGGHEIPAPAIFKAREFLKTLQE